MLLYRLYFGHINKILNIIKTSFSISIIMFSQKHSPFYRGYDNSFSTFEKNKDILSKNKMKK